MIANGIDIVQVARIAEMIRDHGDAFWARVFTAGERSYCESSPKRCAEHAAARFAAKEAAMKCLGTGWRDGIAWTDFEVVRDPAGRPSLVVSGEAARVAAQLGVSRWHVSLSHTSENAVASVIAD
ncbi:MAG: holo-ACP synthase [Tepidisphaera sp.]|jgi:holo-[acyl-carrier protein] synthase